MLQAFPKRRTFYCQDGTIPRAHREPLSSSYPASVIRGWQSCHQTEAYFHKPRIEPGFEAFWCFESSLKSQTGGHPEGKVSTATIEKRDRILVCASCRAAITRDSARMIIKGQHAHRFFNPSGILFQIGCFQQAPGCRRSGSPSHDFCWFSGYQWQIGNCHSCQTHLGWGFEKGARHFWGLILNRLVLQNE